MWCQCRTRLTAPVPPTGTVTTSAQAAPRRCEGRWCSRDPLVCSSTGQDDRDMGLTTHSGKPDSEKAPPTELRGTRRVSTRRRSASTVPQVTAGNRPFVAVDRQAGMASLRHEPPRPRQRPPHPKDGNPAAAAATVGQVSVLSIATVNGTLAPAGISSDGE